MENVNLLDKNAWDDSALIRSWNSALKEYRKYHSIHAKGERVEDVLREEELLLKETTEIAENEDAFAEDDSTMADKFQQRQQKGSCPEDVEHVLHEGDPTWPSLLDGPQMPENLTSGQFKDKKSMKNLMMSWYYAGYYTGFFEGQREASNNEERKKG